MVANRGAQCQVGARGRWATSGLHPHRSGFFVVPVPQPLQGASQRCSRERIPSTGHRVARLCGLFSGASR